jgi:hypothetical protein
MQNGKQNDDDNGEDTLITIMPLRLLLSESESGGYDSLYPQLLELSVAHLSHLFVSADLLYILDQKEETRKGLNLSPSHAVDKQSAHASESGSVHTQGTHSLDAAGPSHRSDSVFSSDVCELSEEEVHTAFMGVRNNVTAAVLVLIDLARLEARQLERFSHSFFHVLMPRLLFVTDRYV